MAVDHDQGRTTLELDRDTDPRDRIERLAPAQGLSLIDHVVLALRRAVADEGTHAAEAAAWSAPSAPSFARDWEPDADAVHDHLA